MKYSLLILLIVFGQNLIAQNDEHIEHNHHNEIGIANASVYFLNEKEFAYGLHIHYLRSINHSQFGIGLGYEKIFDQHQHQTIGIVGNFKPNDRININVSPGITFEDQEYSIIRFAMHLETSYEIEIYDFHLGPVLEFAYDPEDIHISLGIHIGYGF